MRPMRPNMNHTGPSMNPTLKAGDGLGVVPYGNNPIDTGDVVVFRHPEEKYKIVHRVVAVDPQGLITRGDNNNGLDPWVLRPEEIIGRVVSAGRNTKIRKIHGGTRGRMLASVLWAIKNINMTVSKILHPAYHLLARSGLFLKLVPLLPKMRILSFNQPEGNELQLFMGNYMIGRYLPGNDQWRIMRPFRLFVDEAAYNNFSPPR